ncbi:PCNA-interacting partner isoform 10-T10 [Rhynchocyon petersi]
MAVLYQKSILDMMKQFRRNWHTLCNSERTTVCGADSMLLALQLSMADSNKQHNGEFTVSLSDVLLTWKYLLHDKLNLSVENMEAVDHYEDIRKNYDDFLKNSNMVDLIDVYKKCRILTSNCEQSDKITPCQLRDFLSGREYAVDDNSELHVPTSPTSKHNQDNEKMRLLAKKIISSYLNLLINSKNDLALAHILNIPDRGLGREAFTDLKHAAQEKQMSIFLVATSFIRTIQLGGKGYAPSPSDPLRTHVKGLSNFISFIDKLVEILGEIPDPRSPTQMNNSVVKPLRERIQATLQEKKNTKKQLLIRSQFACTYKDDGMISKDKWNSINSASKPWFVLPKENDPSEGVNSSVGRPAIGTSSGNVQLDNSKNKIKSRKSTGETGNKNSKRKKVDLDDENILCDDGTELLHQNNTKIPKTSKDSQNKLNVKLAGVAKGKSTTKDKLIIGQTKLTQFFRL